MTESLVRRERRRLLVVGSQWPLQTFLWRLLTGLSASFDVLIASRPPIDDERFERVALASESWPRPLRIAHSVLSSLPALRSAAGRRLLRGKDWRFLPHLQRSIDAIYFPWNYGATSHLPLMALDLPTIVSCRGAQVQVAPFQPERREPTALLRESFRLATRVHCVSQAILEVSRDQGLDPEKARVIRPAVDIDFFTPDAARLEPGPPWRLMAIGSFIWRKGFEDAILAVKGLVDRGLDVHLDLVGDGRDRQRLLFAVHDLGLEERVTLHGQQPPEKVRELLRQAHVFIVSSFSEGIANVALEAMACGVPVVSTRCGGMAEAIIDGEHGLLVPVQQPAALEAAIGHLLGDESLRRRLGEAARRRVEADFRLDRQVADFADLIFEAIDLNRRPG